ncbi:hypothetical protein CTAYLR_001366 [Chrysophaeum taylorii]|uniref:PH domain-containing protein n=1 Tax=Chrysophaeum taylorii TaxID=2483200 RepID=A0AAD7XHN0_9STRA|nr:hypothetical protein CTAYLR_001366 [Chrysophaeum taylorii]
MRVAATWAPEIRAVIFDIDDTLYPASCGFSAHRNSGPIVGRFMCERLGFDSVEEALAVRTEYFRRYHSTLKGLTVATKEGKLPRPFVERELGEFWAENCDFSMLKPTSFAADFEELSKQKVFFTNSPRAYGLRCLDALGLQGELFAVEDVMPHCKPEAEAFHAVLRAIGREPAECLMVEDSMRNIRACHALGMRTCLVQETSANVAGEAGLLGDMAVAEDPAVDAVVGTLTKRNEQHQWQRRYCALVPQTLLYYFDNEYSESARGIIDLEYYTDVEIVAKNTIRLSTPPDIPLRSFFFRADSEEQCAAWTAALTRERYFVVADERDAYQKLQTEFQMESSATAEKVEKMRAEAEGLRSSVAASELRRQHALSTLRTLAVSMGLSGDAAASLGDAKDAVREVAHRLHYHMRRGSHLEGAIEALRDEHVKNKGGSSASRVREMDELRERLAAVRRAREREATARAALRSEKQTLKSRLDELQHRVEVAAKTRLKLETKAADLADQKKLLVREVKATRKAIARLDADDRRAGRHLRDLALLRVGLSRDGSTSTSQDSSMGDLATSSSDASSICNLDDDLPSPQIHQPRPRPKSPPPKSPRKPAGTPFVLICRRCGGTVEGPKLSTCKCLEPLI